MNERRLLVPFINLGHLLDHLVMLVFPTAVVALARDWGRPYAELAKPVRKSEPPMPKKNTAIIL